MQKIKNSHVKSEKAWSRKNCKLICKNRLKLKRHMAKAKHGQFWQKESKHANFWQKNRPNTHVLRLNMGNFDKKIAKLQI